MLSLTSLSTPLQVLSVYAAQHSMFAAQHRNAIVRRRKVNMWLVEREL
jgi:hypothetical protein